MHKEDLEIIARGNGHIRWNTQVEKDPKKWETLTQMQARYERHNEQQEDKAWSEALRKYARLYNDTVDEKARQKDEAEHAKHRADMDARLAKIDADIAAYDRFREMTAPRPVPDQHRFEHTHILGPAGAGKSTLLQQIVIDDLKKDNPPGYIIIDPKGLMVERIANLQVFDPNGGRLADRLIVIDPTHEPPPALNMFRSTEVNGLTAAQERRLLNHLTETFSYVFASAGSALSQKMTIPFSFIVRLVFSMNGDVNTLMDLLEDKPDHDRFAPYIERLSEQDPGARRFFASDYTNKNFGETRQQIKSRVYELFKNPDVMRVFAATENMLDIPRCIRERKIVLVNTSLAQLGSSGSQLLGRYIISMTLNATFARAMIPKSEWHPAYLLIDEFQDYADEEKTPELLRLAREYNVGVTLAHQTMHAKELNEALRTSISTNTSIKYCASPEGVDMNYMARDLRCETKFLAEQTKTDTHARFACYVRGMNLSHPFRVEVLLGNIEHEPQRGAVTEQSETAPIAEETVETPQSGHYFWGEPAPRGFFASLFMGPNTAPGLYYQPANGVAYLVDHRYIRPEYLPPLPGTEPSVQADPPIPDNPPERESAPLPQAEGPRAGAPWPEPEPAPIVQPPTPKPAASTADVPAWAPRPKK